MPGRPARLGCAALAAAFALVAPPATAQQWFERYTRGLALEEQGKWAPALVEFEAAAALKPVPARRLRVVGGTFILEYDPHYHLARCLAELGRPRLAMQQLKRSAATRVTAREKLHALRARIEAMAEESAAQAAAAARPPSPATPPPPASTRPRTAVSPGQRLTPTAAAPRPTPTEVVAALPVASPPPSPPAVRMAEAAAARRFPGALVGLSALVVLGLVGALWVRSIRRRAPTPAVPTRALDRATTLAEKGGTLGGYELQGVLGRGGMATTFRARRPGDGQPVAVKVPHDSCLADATFVARFLREGTLGEQLHHPRIVRVLGGGEENGRPYLAMELISGRTLKEEVRVAGPLPLRRALEIARDIAEALDYAHAKGVVHRDLKPENVMILPDGAVKVMDFGIARVAEQDGLTSTNVFLGTPLYAAPEMVDPKRVDHRADLYALGIILYEMIEGTVPFTADSPFRVLEMHQHTPLPARERLARRVPERAWSLVTRLCAKSPEERFPSAEALLVELNLLLRDFPMLEGGDVF
jgi:hypothetical protein